MTIDVGAGLVIEHVEMKPARLLDSVAPVRDSTQRILVFERSAKHEVENQ